MRDDLRACRYEVLREPAGLSYAVFNIASGTIAEADGIMLIGCGREEAHVLALALNSGASPHAVLKHQGLAKIDRKSLF